jgi:hypothetical protein
MQNSLFKKELVVGIIILFVGVSVLSSVSSKDISISDDRKIKNIKENEAFDNKINYDTLIEPLPNDLKYKDYKNCRIKTSEDAVDGDAYLFPGFLKALMGVANVKRACGVLIALQYITGHINFDNDTYYGNWNKAFIFWFNGNFEIYSEKAYRVFELDGTAKFVRVYYE